MARPQPAWTFVAHRRVVADEAAHTRRCSDEVDADAPAHAVADDRAAFCVDFVSISQIMPCSIEDLDELAVACGLLRFMDAVSGAEHFVEIRYDGRVAELG